MREAEASKESNSFPKDEQGFPLCIHGNKVVVIEFEDIHLGEIVARCPYKQRDPNFDPLGNPDLLTICKNLCKVNRQNIIVEKLALERAKVSARTNAKYNFEVNMRKLRGQTVGVSELHSESKLGYVAQSLPITNDKFRCNDCSFHTSDNLAALAHIDDNPRHFIPAGW